MDAIPKDEEALYSGDDLRGKSRNYSGERGLVRALPWCSKLRDVIRPGSVLVYARMIRFPSELILEGWPFGRWAILGGISGGRFELELRSRGWQYRHWPRLRAWGIGFSDYTAIAFALDKLISRAERQYRNALEIKSIRSCRLLGIHFVWACGEPATVYWSREHFVDRLTA